MAMKPAPLDYRGEDQAMHQTTGHKTTGTGAHNMGRSSPGSMDFSGMGDGRADPGANVSHQGPVAIGPDRRKRDAE